MHSEGACDEAAYDTAQNARGDRGGRHDARELRPQQQRARRYRARQSAERRDRDRVPAILEHHRAGMSGDLWA